MPSILPKALFFAFGIGAACAQDFPPDVHKFFESNCIKCHGPKKQKGSVRLDDLPSVIGDEATAQRWQDVLDVLNLSEMPPEDEEQPSKQALEDALDQLTTGISAARKRLTDSGGEIVIRRLNRREYANTIKDIFGIAISTDSLPDDEKLDGFDTLGQAQSFSSLHLERYLDLGGKVVTKTMGVKTVPSTVRKSDYGRKPGEYGVEEKKQYGRIMQNVERTSDPNAKVPDKAIFNKVALRGKQLMEEFVNLPQNTTGSVIPYKGINFYNEVKLPSQPGRYRIRVNCGSATDQPQKNLHLQVVRGNFRATVPDATEYFHITGSYKNPALIEFEIEIDGIRANRLELHRRNGKLEMDTEVKDVHDYKFVYFEIKDLWADKQPDLWIDWVEVEGPLPEPEAPLSAKNIFLGNSSDKLSDADARPILENFAYHAFRHRQPETGYLDALERVYKESRDHGQSAKDALTDTLRIVLASPSFLYLYEPRPESTPLRHLTERELAIRLSYFLWSAPPDEELYNLAKDERLGHPGVLAGQIDRMITDPRSSEFVEAFVNAWLELGRLGNVNPGNVSAPGYDKAAQQETRNETLAFFNTLLQENLPVHNLIDSDFAVLNALTADFYGIPGVSGSEFRKVKLPPNSIRGGLLGQSAILALTGNGERTSPVERGVFTLRKIVSRPPSPAPANVPMLDEESVGTRSMRETLDIHMTTPQCASCHRRIDPMGFGLENFDPVGLWRESVLSSDGKATFPIEPAGLMPDGKTQFNDFLSMKKLLSTQRDSLLKGLTESMMTYALGRTVGFTDRDTVDEIVAKTKSDNYGLRSLVHHIILSKAFLAK